MKNEPFEEGLEKVQELQIWKMVCRTVVFLVVAIVIGCLIDSALEYKNAQNVLAAGLCKSWNQGGWSEYKKCS